MRSHGRIWLFVSLVAVGSGGAGASATDQAPAPPDPREAGTPVTVATSVALPTGPWTPTADIRGDLDGIPTTLSHLAAAAAASPRSPRSPEAGWLGFRRPFAETVSYRTTAPPSRVA